MLQTVKQYDGKLAIILQTFQVCYQVLYIYDRATDFIIWQANLVLDSRFSQIVQERSQVIIFRSK